METNPDPDADILPRLHNPSSFAVWDESKELAPADLTIAAILEALKLQSAQVEK